MKFMRSLLTNHPLVNILFSVVLVMGILSFSQMPREQDPEINFNVVNINTVLPGAAAADVEQLVTGPLEDALRKVQDIKFVASSSREGISDIMVRFRELSEREFDKRIADVRREIQSKANDELPSDIEDPYVLEFTTSNGFPTAMVVVVGQADDERLRRQGKLIKEDLERLPGVDRVQAFGFNEPELQVEIDPRALASRGLTAADVADQLRESFQDISAGKIDVATDAWLVRVRGKTSEPEDLANFLISPRSAPQNKFPLDQIARVRRGHAEARQAVSFLGRPGISMSITKVAFTNTLDLVDQISAYVREKNALLDAFGALDELTRLEMQDELLRIWAAYKKTVVFVTHSISEALVLSDRIILLAARPGRIRREFLVPFPRPRKRTDPEMIALYDEIWQSLA